MKKLFFVVLTVMVTCFSLTAQNARFGFTAGAAISNYKAEFDGESDNGNSIVGITAGILADIPISSHFSFQPAANFVQKGTKDEQGTGSETEKVKLTINAIEVPLNFVYNAPGANGSFFVGAGPSFAFAVSGKAKYEYAGESISEDINFGNDEDDDLKGLDIGANVVAGYRFNNGLLIAANFNAGLSNLVPGDVDGASLKSHYFGIRLGWLLKSNKSAK